MSQINRLFRFSLIACLVSWGARAQDNSFAITLQNNAMWQANLTKQMINLGGAYTAGGAPTAASCMPPIDLQRGVDGHVPPELQGDPRYQEYLRCRQGNFGRQDVPSSSTSQAPTQTSHLPMKATDFVPATPGHPTIDQAIADLPMSPEQRKRLHEEIDEMFRLIGTNYRANNLSVSVAVAYTATMTTLHGSQLNEQQSQEFIYNINDQLAHNPKFALLTPQDKQNESDKLIFQTAILSALRNEGAHDPQARQQSLDLSKVMLRQFDSGDTSPIPSANKVVLGVKVGEVTAEIAAAAGFDGSDGAFVLAVTPGSAAAKAGIKAGDILMRVGDRGIRNGGDVVAAMGSLSPRTAVEIRVFRQGVQSDIKVAF
jgi:hypothetical protein